MKNIKVLTDFSGEPVGRYYSDGTDSGERFLDELLLPALESTENVTIDLNDIEGCGSSFLEESFGGLVRYGYYTPEEILSRITVIIDDEAMYQEIMDYIRDAKYNSQKRKNS